MNSRMNRNIKSLSLLVLSAVAVAAASRLPAEELSPGVDLVLKDNHLTGEAPFDLKGNAFSAAVRIKPESMATGEKRQRLVLSVGNGYNHGFRLCLFPDIRRDTYHPFIEFGKGKRAKAWALDAPPGSVVPGYWHRIVATWDGRMARLYVNGREVAADRYEHAYVPPPPKDYRARTGVPGESYGILSTPHMLDRATVWTRCISPEEVAAYDPGDAFEPDTPQFADLIKRIIKGDVPSEDEIVRAKGSAHSESFSLMLDSALVLAKIKAKDLEGSLALRSDVLERIGRTRGGKVAAQEFVGRCREVALANGFADAILQDLRVEFAELRKNNASHLPYAALQLMKAAERTGHTTAVEKIRNLLLSMDLRRFPQIRTELGLDAEYTAHGQPGASVSRAMPTRAFHVSPAGDDSANGSREAPFRTLRRARDAIRAWRKTEGLPQDGVAVLLHGGTYPVTGTLELSE